jgi:hypothetical protein
LWNTTPQCCSGNSSLWHLTPRLGTEISMGLRHTTILYGSTRSNHDCRASTLVHQHAARQRLRHKTSMLGWSPMTSNFLILNYILGCLLWITILMSLAVAHLRALWHSLPILAMMLPLVVAQQAPSTGVFSTRRNVLLLPMVVLTQGSLTLPMWLILTAH